MGENAPSSSSPLANRGKEDEDNLDRGIKGLATFRGEQRKQTHISSGKKWPEAQAKHRGLEIRLVNNCVPSGGSIDVSNLHRTLNTLQADKIMTLARLKREKKNHYFNSSQLSSIFNKQPIKPSKDCNL